MPIAARAGTRPISAPQSYRCRITVQGSLGGGAQSQTGYACRITATGSLAGAPKLGAKITAQGSLAGGWRPKVLITVQGSLGGSPVGATWNGFAAVRRIDIPADHVRGGSDIPDYMLLVDETSTRLRSTGNSGIVQFTDGKDIRFELGNGTKLDHELAEYDPVVGRLLAWVRVPLLSATAGATLYLWYGKSGLSVTEANPAGAWRNYAAVWNARTGADRTGLGRTLTPANVTAGALIGDAGDYNGTNANAQSPAGLPWLNGLPSLTIEAWWKADAIGHSRGILSVGGGADTTQAAIIRYADTGNAGGAANTIVALVHTPAGDARVEAPANSQSTDIQYGALRWASGQAGSFFLNTELVTPSNVPMARTGTTDIGTDTALQLGSGLAADSWWAGLIDEVRIRGGVLSEGVLQTQAHNYRYPATFYGIGEEDAFTTVNKSVVSVPIVGQVTAGQSVDLDILPRCINPGPGSLAIQGYTSPSRGAVTTVGGKARYTPGGTAAGEGSFTFTVGNSARSDTAMARVLVGAGGAVSTGLPAGYPTPPSFAGAETVNVSTRAQLQAAVDGAPLTGAGRIIVLAPGVNYCPGVPYAPITVNRSTARIKLVCNTPRFSGLITDRATLDSINLTVTSNTDPVVANNCIPGGLRAHSATARVGLSVTRCGILWVEGLDFHDPHKLMVNRTSSETQGCDQLWVRRCSFSESDTNLIGLGGTSGRGADIFVAWENYLFGDGTRADPGQSGTATGGVWTDYPMQFYNCGDLFIYKCIFHGGSNHSISTKLACGPLRVDDCVFANYHPADYSWKNFELGQEGSPTGNDRTCRLTTVKGCTFTAATGTTKYNVAMLKDVTGFIFDGNIVYDGPGGFLDVRPAPSRSGPNDQGTLAGSQGILVQNNLFGRPGALAQPGACNLDVMYTDSGGGYVFTARNNQYSAVRAVNILARARTRVSTSYGPNPGFSG